MAGEWAVVPLTELTITPPTYGVVQPGKDTAIGLPMLRVNNFQGHSLNLSEVMRIAPEIESKYGRTRIQTGDVLITIVGSVGQVAVVPEELSGWNIARAIAMIRPNKPELSRWISLVLRSPQAQYQLGVAANTTVQTTINLKDLRELRIPLPDDYERNAIAHILGTLDDKIELNRRHNQTLEAMARALFKDWFVDFGPVRAKMEGREPYLPADLWQLFPDRLDDEGKPEGWEQQRVKDIGQVICGKTPPTKVPEYYGDDVPFITIPEMHGKIFSTSIQKRLSLAGANSQAKKMLPPGAICVSCIATLGLVTITTESSQTNQQINSVIPAEGNETYYWYWTLKNLGEEIKAGGSGGSVLGNLSTGRFSELQVNAGTRALRVAYNSSVESMFAHILANERESASLAQLRDTLLPKLISGELRIADAEKFMERVV